MTDNLTREFDVMVVGSDPVTNEFSWVKAIVDQDVFDEIVKGSRWHSEHGYIYKSQVGPRDANTMPHLHHLVMGQAPDEFRPYIDHVNGNRADNRRANLRWCDKLENNNNIPMNPPLNEEQFPLGVRSEFIDPETFRTRTQMCVKWHKPSKRWKVRNFSYEREPEYFKNLTEACEAHDKRCREAWEAAHDGAGRKRARKMILLKRNAIGESETGSDRD